VTVTEIPEHALRVIVGPTALHVATHGAWSACGLAGGRNHRREWLTITELAERRLCSQPGCRAEWPAEIRPDGPEPLERKVVYAPGTYSTQAVADMIGASYRQLDYWVRTGVVDRPAVGNRRVEDGSGTRRRWAAEQVPTLLLVARLRDLGATDEHIRDAIGVAGPSRNWDSAVTFFARPGVGFYLDLPGLRTEAERAMREVAS
jgi:DNA-binding transcriptional MerR regulator